MRTCAHHGRDNGVGLIELMIAMAIFLVGIVALVRVFPVGLNTVENSQNNTIGSRISSDMLAQYATTPQQLPDAVINPADPYITPDTMPEDDPTNNALDTVRRIVGEQDQVTGGAIKLRFGPIDSFVPAAGQTSGQPNADGATPDNPRVYKLEQLVQVSSTPTQRNQWYVGNPSQPIVQFQTVTGSEVRYYRITYTWFDTTNSASLPPQRVFVENYWVKLSTSTGTDRVTLPTPPGSTQGFLDPGTMRVVEEVQVPISSMSTDQVSAGVVPVPSANAAGDPISNGDWLSVDYTVNNWRWVNETESVAGNGILDLAFSALDDSQPLTLVKLPGLATATITPTTTFPSNGVTAVDYPNGRITFDTSTVPAGTRFDVIYTTLQQWAVQVQRPPATFYPAVGAGEIYRQFAARPWRTPNATSIDQEDTGLNGTYSGDGTKDGPWYYIGFKPCVAGMTVAVDYTTDDNYDGVPEQTIRGELHTIPTDPADEANNQAVFTGSDPTNNTEYGDFLYQIRLNHPYHEILAVRGVSTRSRAAWNDTGTYRKLLIATYLSPPLNRL